MDILFRLAAATLLGVALIAGPKAFGATAEETRLYRVAQAAFGDGLNDLAEQQAAQFLEKFPSSERGDAMALLLGRAQLNQGKWQQAIETFTKALERWPDKRPDAFRFWHAEVLLRGERFTEAEARYAEVIKKYGSSSYLASAEYGLAFVQFKQGKLNPALETVKRLLKRDLSSELAQEAGLLLGQIHLALEQPDKVEAAFDEVIRKFPGLQASYHARVWLGELYVRRKRFTEAQNQFTIVLDAFKSKPGKPVDAELAAEAWSGLGWVHWWNGAFDQAAEAFSQALASAPSAQLKRDAMLKLGEAYVRAGKLAEGVAKLRAFLQANPTDPQADEVRLAIGDLLYGSGECAAALAAYAELTSKHPQSALLAKAHLNTGWCAWKLGQTTDALKEFQQAFDLAQPKDRVLASEALFKVADAQFTLGQYAEAVGNYQRLIGEYADTGLLDRALFQLGQTYQQARNAEAALITFQTLLEQHQGSPYAPETQFQIGVLYSGLLGNEAKARDAFRAVTAKYPQSDLAGRAALAVGESFYREGKSDEAIAEFQKLIDAAPESELGQRAFYLRGRCQAQKGSAEKTQAEFSEFLTKYPKSPLAPDVQFWVADFYARRQDYINAQQQFDLLAKNYPTNELADVAQYMAGRAAYSRQDYKTAKESFEALIKTFTNSAWRCDALFSDGDALTELGQFESALVVFDLVTKQFGDCYLVCEAHGRKGDCLFTSKRFEEAAASYRAALDCAVQAEAAMRNQLYYKLGQSYEQLGKLAEAYESYSRPVYEQIADPNALPDRFWLGKAGMAAAGIKEQQQQWREAKTLYKRLIELCPDLKPMLEDRIRRIIVQHPELMF
jgi:TolA-binding protein